MKKKIIFMISLIILIIIILLCYFKYINKAYKVKVIGFHVSQSVVDGYYPILHEVVLEFKTKGKNTIIEELKKNNVDYANSSKIYIWNDKVRKQIDAENQKRKSESNDILNNYEFTNELEEISWNTIINKDISILIEINANDNKILNCLENELNGYIVTEKSKISEIPLQVITNKNDKIQYYKGLKTKDNNMYVIYKNTPSEYEVMKDFDLYFSKQYAVYQKFEFNNTGLFIFIYNDANDIDYRELQKKCSFNHYENAEIINIPNNTIKKINNTEKIKIKVGEKELTTINDTIEINNILNIISKASQYSFNGAGVAYLCDGYSFNFDLYDKNNKLIDTIYVWSDGIRLIPKSIHSGCSYYSISTDDDLRLIIEKLSDYQFYGLIDYSEVCSQALELIYEDDNYEYYFNCIKSDMVLIDFYLTNQTMTLKYALNNNYIKPEQLNIYGNLLIKKEK